MGKSGLPYRTDVKFRVENAWSSIDLYDLLIVIFDVHRHLTKYANNGQLLFLLSFLQF